MSSTDEERGSLTEAGPETYAEAREEALDFLEGLLDAMDLDGEVGIELTEDGLQAFIEGEDSGILIGRRGHTLEAVQDLLRTAVQRHVKERIRISLDIEGYRERRRETLTSMAREAADSALRDGDQVEMEPMSAFERRVVHETVAEIEGVESFSEGEDPRRRVIIRATAPT